MRQRSRNAAPGPLHSPVVELGFEPNLTEALPGKECFLPHIDPNVRASIPQRLGWAQSSCLYPARCNSGYDVVALPLPILFTTFVF